MDMSKDMCMDMCRNMYKNICMNLYAHGYIYYTFSKVFGGLQRIEDQSLMATMPRGWAAGTAVSTRQLWCLLL